nr:hypothetical protein [Tanacetum cinerariifolium]
GNPQQKEYKGKGVIDSGCFRHMTGNKCYLTDFEAYDGGFVSFRDGKGRISGKDKDIKREYSVARTPQQNGVTERRNRTLIEAARTMSVDSKLPTTFWAEVVNIAGYVLNRALVTKPHNKTPYELIRERPPLIDFMKPFGCPDTILNTRDNLGKFEGKADEGYFVGNGPDWLFDIDSLTISMKYVPVGTRNQTNGIAGTKENLVACQVKKKKELEQEYILIPICTTNPLISQDAKDSEEDAGKKAPKVAASEASDNGGQDNQVSRSEDGSLFQQDRLTEHNNSTNDINTVSSPVSTDGSSFVNAASQTPINVAGPSANAYKEHSFERFSLFKNAFSLSHVPMVTPIDDIGIFGNAYDDDVLEEDVDMNNVDSSYTIPEATKFLKDHPQEQMEPKKPVQSLQDPSWVEAMQEELLNKKDEREIVIKNKARLVAQGHTQEEEEVYVYQPPGFEDLNFPDKVYKVEKALYGLHQAPRACYETLSTYLHENGFHKSQIDKTAFIKRHKDDILLVQVYVDYIIFGSTNQELSTEFEKLMHDKFQMSSMRELSFFLGLQVKQKSDGIFISQDKYVAEILKKFDFVTMKTASTPMKSDKPLIKDEEAEDVDVHLHRSMIGSLIHLIASRLDITFSVCACARFHVTLTTSHLHDVKRIFRYLKGQPKLGLWYPKDSPFDLETYSDSDYARASLNMKSTT